MTDKHDYDFVLKLLDQTPSDTSDETWREVIANVALHLDTIKTALKIAKRVSEEPSVEMNDALQGLACCSGYTFEGIRAMLDQLLREVVADVR